MEIMCPTCNGKKVVLTVSYLGYTVSKPCPTCKGTGKIVI